MPTVYSLIRGLVLERKLSQAGRGLYRSVHKPKFEVVITEWMCRVKGLLVKGCEGVDHCIYEKSGNLYVETYKGDIPRVMDCLKQHSPKVIRQKDAKAFPAPLEGYIIMRTLVSDSPIISEERLSLPSLEKMLVDNLSQKGEDEKSRQFAFQKAMEVYPVNVNRMKRYVARRGLKEEMTTSLLALDNKRMALFSTIQKYLADIPVLRAWVFGSFARGEETPESDLDLLVDYDPTANVSLLDIIRYKKKMEQRIGRDVDLVENGYLKLFAVPSKYLVYETLLSTKSCGRS